MHDVYNMIIVIFFCGTFYVATHLCVHFSKQLIDSRFLFAFYDPYKFTSTSLPEDVRLWPSIGNGHVSSVVYSQNVYMNGLYNGRGNRSHRASIPSPNSANVTRINSVFPLSRIYVLLAKEGIFQETITMNDSRIILEWYMHRAISPLMVFEIEVVRTLESGDTPLHVELNVSRLSSSPDINFTESRRINELFFTNQVDTSAIYFRQGLTKEPETDTSGKESVSCMFVEIPPMLTVGAGVLRSRWTFLASVHAHKKEVYEAFERGKQLLQSGNLRTEHTKQWIATWNNGSIEVEGNNTIARAVIGSQYYIFSSLPSTEDTSWPFIGLSPSGLAWGDSENYFGHVFWDQETWMYPPMLLLHADLSWLMLQSRFRTMTEAAANANLTGYRGLRYPWESAFTGVETTESNTCATQEIHINGDIAFAFEQFWWSSGDEKFLSNNSKMVDVVFGIADFWISRLTFNDSRKLFEIHDVQPPDEYASAVNNSVYTNVVAKKSLGFASEIAKILKITDKQRLYENYASRLYLPFDAAFGYHPEYDGYALGTTVKQADVILLGFPLMWNMTSDVRLKDLETYEEVTSPRGPAMSDSMYAIGWLEVQQYERAVKSFSKMFKHVSNDFQVWTENKGGGGATNFITGMGGFLQSIMFGFGGIRLHSQYMDVSPVLPPGCTRLLLRSIDYRGSSVSLEVGSAWMTLTLTSQGRRKLCVSIGSKTYVLRQLQPVTVATGKLQLVLCESQFLRKYEVSGGNRNLKL